MSSTTQPVSDAERTARQPGDRIDATYRQLRGLIVEGGLAPGTRVIEADLARRLDVSRTPVRSALHRLQQEGYVIPANGGNLRTRLMVAPLTAGDASDLFNIVAELEGLAGRYAAHLDSDQRSRLTEQLDELNAELLKASRAERPDANTVFELDAGIHRRLVEAAAPPRLLNLHAAIKPQAERFVDHSDDPYGRRRCGPAVHPDQLAERGPAFQRGHRELGRARQLVKPKRLRREFLVFGF